VVVIVTSLTLYDRPFRSSSNGIEMIESDSNPILGSWPSNGALNVFLILLHLDSFSLASGRCGLVKGVSPRLNTAGSAIKIAQA
jgi:hypothetical protein